jgi:hypothetical protein
MFLNLKGTCSSIAQNQFQHLKQYYVPGTYSISMGNLLQVTSGEHVTFAK